MSLGTCQALGEAPDFHDPAVSRDTSHFTVEPMEASERLRHGPKAASGYVGQLQSQRPFLKGATLLLEKWGIRRALREGETVAPATPGAGACVARVGGGSRCVPVTCLRCQWSLSDLQGAASQVGTVPGSGFRCSQRSGQLDQPQSHLPRS